MPAKRKKSNAKNLTHDLRVRFSSSSRGSKCQRVLPAGSRCQRAPPVATTAPVSFRETGSCSLIYTASIVGPPSPTPCSILFSFRLTCSAVSDAHPANRDMFCILSDFHSCGTASLPFILTGSDFYEFISSIFIWQSRRDHVLIQLSTMVSPLSLFVNSGFMGISHSGLSEFLFQVPAFQASPYRCFFKIRFTLLPVFFIHTCRFLIFPAGFSLEVFSDLPKISFPAVAVQISDSHL